MFPGILIFVSVLALFVTLQLCLYAYGHAHTWQNPEALLRDLLLVMFICAIALLFVQGVFTKVRTL